MSFTQQLSATSLVWADWARRKLAAQKAANGETPMVDGGNGGNGGGNGTVLPPEVIIRETVGTPAGTPSGELPASATPKNNTILYVALGVTAVIVAVLVLRKVRG
jgi:hypothetical protein